MVQSWSCNNIASPSVTWKEYIFRTVFFFCSGNVGCRGGGKSKSTVAFFFGWCRFSERFEEHEETMNNIEGVTRINMDIF